MKNYFRYISNLISTGDRYIFVSALFATLYILFQLNKDVSFQMTELDSIIVSQATLDNVSIPSRVQLFFSLIFKGTILLLLLYLVFSWIFGRYQFQKKQKESLFQVAIVGISIIVIELIQIQSEILNHGIFSVFLFLILLFILSKKINHYFLRKLASPLFIGIVLTLSFILSFSVIYLTGASTFFLLIYWLSVSVIILSLFVLIQFFSFTLRKAVFFILPLCCTPFLAFLSVEYVVYHFLNNDFSFGYKKVYALLIIVTLFIHFILFIRRKKQIPSTLFLYKYFIGPGAILAFGLLCFYFPIMQHATDLFELANPANAIMRIFEFQEIPFVDFMSSHVFSEQWYGIIYSIIFGYSHPVDYEVYSFFNFIIYFFIIYYFLNKLFCSPIFSVFFIISFPFLFQIFFAHLLLCLFTLFMVKKAIKTQKTIDYLFVFLFTIALIIWKLDTGVANLIAVSIYLPIMLVLSNEKINYQKIAKAVVFLLALLVSMLGIALLLRNGSYIYDNFMAALHYVKANQAHGYTSIANSYPQQFYLYYFIYPAISVLLIIWIFYLLMKDKTKQVFSPQNKKILHAALFLFILSLANGQRGIVRHGFAEMGDLTVNATFFLACSLVLIYILRVNGKQQIQTSFYGFSFAVFLLLKFFPHQPEKGMFERAITETAFLTLHTDLHTKKPFTRTVVNESISEMTQEFKSFLDANLKPNQTFLDFSNSPILYSYSGRKVPGYFCQNLQNTVDDYLQFHLLKSVDTKTVPVVVFSNYPPTWFDKTDDVPNTMRYYWIAEFIYKNYTPYAIIGGKDIWIANDFRLKQDKEYSHDNRLLISKNYENKHLPRLTYLFHEKEGFEGLEFAETLTLKNDTIAAFNLQKTNFHHHCYVLISYKEMKNNEKKTVSLCDEKGNEYESFSFYGQENVSNYMLRISSARFWHSGLVTSLKIKSEYGKDMLHKITVIKDNRIEN